jgi:hypothetical protein
MNIKLPPRLSPSLIAVALLLSADWTAQARPPIRVAFFSTYTNAVGSKLDSLSTKAGHCGACHYDFNGGGTRNPYGAAVEVVYNSNGKNAAAAIASVRGADSETDGYTTDTEVTNTITYANTPTFPGLKTANTSLIVNLTAAQLSELAAYLTPVIGGDTTAPVVTLLAPNGGQTLTANVATNVTWSASDASGIAAINLFLSLDNGTTWQPIAKGLNGVTSYSWVPSDRPSTQARIRPSVATGKFPASTPVLPLFPSSGGTSLVHRLRT